MAKGKIAAKQPTKVDLIEGKNYAWCACGESSNQPFCDGSHKGTEFSPVVFKAEASKTAWLCVCKQTNNPGFCDGTHKTL